MIKVCTICESEFEPNHWRDKFCSEECRTDGIRQAHARYCAKNKEKIKDRARIARKRFRAENPERDRETNRQWRLRNPERDREHNRRKRVKVTAAIAVLRDLFGGKLPPLNLGP